MKADYPIIASACLFLLPKDDIVNKLLPLWEKGNTLN